MTYQQGALCSDANLNNVSASWTMIAASDVKGWAQSGYWFHSGETCWRHFAQQVWGYPANPPYTIEGTCVNPGEQHRVWQQTVVVGAPQYWAIRSNVDVTIFIQSSWNQFGVWANPLIAEFNGETHHYNSDVPGSSANPTDFHGPMQVQNYANDQFYDTCGFISLYPAAAFRYATDQPSCDHVRVWTK